MKLPQIDAASCRRPYRVGAPFQSLHQDRRAHITVGARGEFEEGPPPRYSRSLGSLQFRCRVFCDLAPELIGMFVGRPGVDTSPDARVDDLLAHFCEGLP